MSFDAKAFLKTLTSCPGIYQMLDLDGKILYVGKAKNLKKRVASYFQKQLTSQKTIALVKQIADIRVMITQTENEALLLESNLIKELQPPFNVLLRDDKSYPYIHISEHPEFPRLDLYRGFKKPKGHFFGPYPSVSAVRESLNLLQRTFRLRSCEDSYFNHRTRPCLQYHIKRCTAPCVGKISATDYQQDLSYAALFLAGKNREVVQRLAQKMEEAAQVHHYELAAKYRDQIANLRQVQERQYVYGEAGDADIIALAHSESLVCIQVMFIRDGRILGNSNYFPKVPELTELPEVLASFITQYYLTPTSQHELPQEIIVNLAMPEADWLQAALSEQAGHAVKLTQQVRGDKVNWTKMAVLNAQQALNTKLATRIGTHNRLIALQEALGLAKVPERLECFDISHTGGEAAQASCVVFNGQGPLKSDYRRFNIKQITAGDDYAAMRQALKRRYKRLQAGEAALPDILVIDGGKGQLTQARAILDELTVVGVTLLGIAKGPSRKAGLEEIILQDADGFSVLEINPQALLLLQQIRDEAHRFAIAGHRQRRAKVRNVSSLEQIPGIGAKRRRELLRQLGGLQEVKAASIEQLAQVPGINLALAERIYQALHG